MADEIKQKIGLDVTDAIKALEQLDTKLDAFGEKLDEIAKGLGKFNKAAQQALDLGKTGRSLDDVGDKARDMGGNLTKAAAEAKLFGNAVDDAGKKAADGAKEATESTATLGTKTVSNTKKAGNAFTRFANRTKQRLAALLKPIREIGQETAQMGAAGARGLKSLIVPLHTMARILGTQLIVRGLNAISQAMSQSFNDAKEFQLQISEIRTITDDTFNSFDKAAQAVRGVSDAFNIPLGQVGEGLYQTISNQIQGAASQMAVLESSAKLAKVGVADFDDTVSLLTGTINAFELDAQDADRVSAVLFKTVEKGRTRISELASSFGTVAPLAKEAGLSFEELAASFATVTINGVDTAKAATQLRGIINAFIKPTDAMAQVLAEAGFASGETAIKVLGFAGAMDLIQQASGGSATKLAELIPRVRGLSGAMVLARNEGQDLKDNLEELINVTNELIDEKLELRIETGAEKLERELNQIKNAFTVDFGQSIVNAAGAVSRFLNLGDNMAILIKGLIPAIVGLGAVLLVYGGAAAFAAAKTIVLAGSFTTLTAGLGALPLVIIAAVAAAYGLAKAIEASTSAANDAAARGARERHAEQLKDERKARNEIVQGTIQQLEKQFNAASKYVADIRALMSKRVQAWKESNKKIQEDTNAVFDGILSANKKLVDDLAQSRDDANARAADASSNIASLQATAADEAFKFENRRFNAVQQTSRLEQRSLQLARQGSEALRSARSDADREAANAILQRAQAFSQEAQSQADATGNAALINRVFQSRLGIINQIVAAEEEQVRRQKAAAAEAERNRQIEQKRVNELASAILKAQNAQAKFNVESDPAKRQAAQEEFLKSLAEVDRLAIPKDGLIKADQFMDYANFRQNLLDNMVELEQRGIDVRATISGDRLNALAKEIEDTWAKAIELGISKGMEAGLGRDAARGIYFSGPSLEALDKLQEAIIEQKDASIAAVKKEEALKQASEDMAGAVKEMEAIQNRNTTALEKVGKGLLGLPAVLSATVEGLGKATGLQDETSFDTAEKVFSLQQKTLALAKQLADPENNITVEQLQERLDVFNRLRDEISNAPQATLRLIKKEEIAQLDASIGVLDNMLQKMREANTLGAETRQLNQEALQTGGVEQARQKVEADRQSKQELEGGKQATDGQVSGLSQAVSQSNQLASNAERYAAAMNSVQPAQGTATARLGRYFTRYFAGGGFAPRGTDTIPAMLSPGEFVVNAKSTRKFFSQLQAINAGRMPVYRQEGGPVSQTTVGDINVTVNGAGKSNDQTGRTIARSLRRELRRNTSSL